MFSICRYVNFPPNTDRNGRDIKNSTPLVLNALIKVLTVNSVLLSWKGDDKLTKRPFLGCIHWQRSQRIPRRTLLLLIIISLTHCGRVTHISMASCKTSVSPIRLQWGYCSFALSNRYTPDNYTTPGAYNGLSPWPLLLTLINFNPSMDKWLHPS